MSINDVLAADVAAETDLIAQLQTKVTDLVNANTALTTKVGDLTAQLTALNISMLSLLQMTLP